MNLPPISASVPIAIRKPLEAMRQALLRGTTRTGPGKFVTVAEIVNGTVSAPTATYPVPVPITGFIASGAFAIIILEWDAISTVGFSHVNVYRAALDDIGQAVNVGDSIAPLYSDTPPNSSTSVTYYYWIRAVNLNGVEGPFNQTAGTSASTANDPQYALDILAGKISSTELAASLSTQISLIDTPVTGLVDSLAQELIDRAAAISTEQTSRVAADSAIATDITTIQADVGANAAAISTEQTSRVAADSAIATDITMLQTKVGNPAGGTVNSAIAQSEANANAYADSADATMQTQLQASIDGVIDHSLIGDANNTITGNSVVKTGVIGWNSQVYSNNGYIGSASCSFTNGSFVSTYHFMAGLNTDPTTNANYNTIDYC